MSGALPHAVLLAVALIAANLPFLSERVLFVLRPARAPKRPGWRLLEFLLMYFAVLLFAAALEASQGPLYPQKWEFYAVTFFLFLVLGYPGFVWRYLWRGKR